MRTRHAVMLSESTSPPFFGCLPQRAVRIADTNKTLDARRLTVEGAARVKGCPESAYPIPGQLIGDRWWWHRQGSPLPAAMRGQTPSVHWCGPIHAWIASFAGVYDAKAT